VAEKFLEMFSLLAHYKKDNLAFLLRDYHFFSRCELSPPFKTNATFKNLVASLKDSARAPRNRAFERTVAKHFPDAMGAVWGQIVGNFCSDHNIKEFLSSFSEEDLNKLGGLLNLPQNEDP